MEEFERDCMARGREVGLEEGREVGRKEGAEKMGELGSLLLAAGRTEDLKKSFSDSDYRNKLFKEFGIA